MKSWAPAKIGVDDQDTEGDVDACNLSCLVGYIYVVAQGLILFFAVILYNLCLIRDNIYLIKQVAVGRIQPMHCINDTIGESTIKSGPPRPPTLSMEFTSRHVLYAKLKLMP